jgi:hypothetical protein
MSSHRDFAVQYQFPCTLHPLYLLLTTGFGAFAESGVPLGEGPFRLGEGFTESLLSAKASRRLATREGLFAESCGPPSRWMCAER